VFKIRVIIFAEGPTTLTMRILPLMRFLEGQGFNCKLVPEVNWRAKAGTSVGNFLSIFITHSPAEYIKTLVDCPDIVISSKTSNPQMYLLESLLKQKNIKFLFDITDATYLYNSCFFGIPMRPHSDNIEQVIQKADSVTTNGHYLQNYTLNYNKNSFLVHDPVDCQIFYPRPKPSRNCITLGWEGNPTAHLENLILLINPLERICNEFKVKLKIVAYLGDQRVKKMFEKLEPLIEIDYGSPYWLTVSDFAQAISEFDVLLAPIQKTPWYEGKSALRVGIGMATGVPVVASPVGEQKYVIRHGFNGFLAKDEDDWYKYLKLLIENKTLRTLIGSNGRATAEKELSTLICGKKLADILYRMCP
jgi:glycosyltransferase involved in cell wall biosynthesis